MSAFQEKGTTGAQMLAVESDDELKKLGMTDVGCVLRLYHGRVVGQASCRRLTGSICCSSWHERVLQDGSQVCVHACSRMHHLHRLCGHASSVHKHSVGVCLCLCVVCEPVSLPQPLAESQPSTSALIVSETADNDTAPEPSTSKAKVLPTHVCLSTCPATHWYT